MPAAYDKQHLPTLATRTIVSFRLEKGKCIILFQEHTMSIFEGLIKPTLTPSLNIDMSEKTGCNTTNHNHYNIGEYHNHFYLSRWLLFAMLLVAIGLHLSSCSPVPPSAPAQPTTLEHQAALGGAVIPFPNGNPSPMPSAMPLGDWSGEIADSPSMSPSEPPLLDSPQADAGQTRSTRFYRPLFRRTW